MTSLSGYASEVLCLIDVLNSPHEVTITCLSSFSLWSKRTEIQQIAFQRELICFESDFFLLASFYSCPVYMCGV